MIRKKQRSTARGSVLVLCVLSSLLMTGCTKAVFDAAAAGVLNFIQTGVMTTLTNVVFGDTGMTGGSTEMGGMVMTSGSDHDDHGG